MNFQSNEINLNNEKVFVCGSGHQGLSMAAHLALNNVSVTLWNRTYQNIESIVRTNEIVCDGIIEGTAIIEKASSKIEDVVSDFVMVTTPSTAHKDVARELAPYVHENMVIILNPGRTFGAVEFMNELKHYGATKLPHIAETQTIVYTCRKRSNNSVTIFALKKDVKIASLQKEDLKYILNRMPLCLKKYFLPVNSILETSLSNVGMILHCAPVLMNIGWIENDAVDFKYYYDGISKSIADFLGKIDEERLKIAKTLDCEVASLVQWLNFTYGIEGENIYESIRNNPSYKRIDAPNTINSRYILEDVPNGLVPIEYLGECLGIKTPNITTVINLASSVLNIDFRKNGRRYSLDMLKEFI